METYFAGRRPGPGYSRTLIFQFVPGSGPARIRPGRPIYGPEAVLRDIGWVPEALGRPRRHPDGLHRALGPSRGPPEPPGPVWVSGICGPGPGGSGGPRDGPKALCRPSGCLRGPPKGLRDPPYVTQYCFRAVNRPSGPDSARTATGKKQSSAQEIIFGASQSLTLS